MLYFLQGIWDPRFDPDGPKPLPYKSTESLSRSTISCDWIKHKHWCRLHHTMNCIMRDQMVNRTSIAYLNTGGRLGNAMTAYATMLTLRHRFGLDAMVDLTTFQMLDMVFSNVREVPIIEERVCVTRSLDWVTFDDHIRKYNASSLNKGKAIFFWPRGIASEEYIHGPAQLLLPNIYNIRKAFTFR